MISPGAIRRRSASLLAAIALAIGLSACATPTHTSEAGPPAGPTAAMCGPGSQPAVSNGENRYIPCDYDLRHARVFLDTALPLLPTEAVDAAAVDEVAADDSYLAGFASEYQGAQLGSDGSVIASWIPTPDTCAVYTWDGERWDSEIVGELVTGGCVAS